MEETCPEKAGDGCVCLRRAGHRGRCISLARDALLADGVCLECKVVLGERGHLDGCLNDWKLALGGR